MIITIFACDASMAAEHVNPGSISGAAPANILVAIPQFGLRNCGALIFATRMSAIGNRQSAIPRLGPTYLAKKSSTSRKNSTG
jgi:hypothetical protein